MKNRRIASKTLGILSICIGLCIVSCGKVNSSSDEDGGGSVDAGEFDGGSQVCAWGESNWDACNWAP